MASLILAGSAYWRYSHVVEEYLDIYLRTPDLSKDDIARALLARGLARNRAGHQLFLMASRGSWRSFHPVYLADCLAHWVRTLFVALRFARCRHSDGFKLRPIMSNALASGACRSSVHCSLPVQ
jgi:hypothetical protein